MAKNDKKPGMGARRKKKSLRQAPAVSTTVKKAVITPAFRPVPMDSGIDGMDPQAGDANESRTNMVVVGIGASAGGLDAFEQLLNALPTDTGMAFVLVQHLAPQHESILTELLARTTIMPVTEVVNGVRVEANHVYVIPPNAEMAIGDGTLRLSPLRLDRSLRMPIDCFLRSLAEERQGRAIGIILSGTASDGTLGLQAIKAAGGVTFAQDETAKFNAMPRSAVASGMVDFVLPPDQIARELARIAKHIHVFASDDSNLGETDSSADEALNKIFLLLRNFSRVDFSYYKHGTIKRRIAKRMFLRRIDRVEEYARFLRKNPDEVEALFNDALINVTEFFRDPEAFESLRSVGFPTMMAAKPAGAAIRLWVPGCSTGEEPYSLAIALLEFLGDMANSIQIQIFATDISDATIQKARLGIYSESIAMDVSQDRLRRFFQKVDKGYQISKTIRDMCVFARQDIARDPVFSKIDMVSCRNVLIYMGQVLQKRVISLFHYALTPGGVLFLGSSETIGSFSDLFTPLDKKYKIYSKQSMSVPFNFDFIPQLQDDTEEVQTVAQLPIAANKLTIHSAVDQMLLNRYAPASVVVDDRLNIVQFNGQTGQYLEPAPGEATLNLLKMVKTGLHLELRRAFQKVRRTGIIRKERVLIEHDGGFKTVNFEIIAVKNLPVKERYFVVAFEESRSDEPNQNVKSKKKSTKKLKPPVEAARLKDELDATREYLQSIIEEQRSTNEELSSANEEIQSSNEELQSINEELETAKEELQSTNEELTTVNEELQNRNDELSLLNNDLNNLLSSVNIPIVMLGNDLRVRRFTPLSEKVMNLIPTDIGRPITDIKPNIKVPDLKRVISHVVQTLEIAELQVEDTGGRWYSMKIRPYRTMENKIDGVVIVLLDLDRANQTMEAQGT